MRKGPRRNTRRVMTQRAPYIKWVYTRLGLVNTAFAMYDPAIVMMIYALLSTVNMGLSPLLSISYHSLVSSHPPTYCLFILYSLPYFLHMIPLRAFSTIPVSSTLTGQSRTTLHYHLPHPTLFSFSILTNSLLS